MESIRELFERFNYVVLRAAVKKSTVAVLYRYALHYGESSMATSDDQVPGAPAAYGDPVMDQLLEGLRPGVETVCGRDLFSTYSYFRIYRHGHVLKRHRDRQSCEISLSLNLGYEGAASWPLYVKASDEVFAADLAPGDALLYKGMECDHWRDPFEGTLAAQLFLHYVDRNGKYREWRFDKRKGLTQTARPAPDPGRGG